MDERKDMNTGGGGRTSPDDALLRLVQMAGEAEALERSDTALGDDRVLARVGPAADTLIDVPSEAEITRRVSARLAELPSMPRSKGNWRGPLSALMAACICGGVILWPMLYHKQQQQAQATKRGEAGPGSGDARMASAEAAGAGDAAMAGERPLVGDFERPLAAGRAESPLAVPVIAGGADGSSVFFVVNDNGRCGCARLDQEQFARTARLVEEIGSRVVFAREDSGSGRVITASDFACFQSQFAKRSGRAFEGPMSCDGTTVAPALSISDFVCFTSRMAQGCM